MYLIDTNVVSELRRSKSRKPDPQVVAWIGSVPVRNTYLSVVSAFELERGILSIGRRDAAKSAMLREWLEGVLIGFAGRILPVDLDIATRCAALHVPVTPPERDAWIAATALVHGMTVVTRNVADFEPMGVAVLNPWEF
jgi:toxin FitB